MRNVIAANNSDSFNLSDNVNDEALGAGAEATIEAFAG
jgi:hypothetical protein